MARATVFRSRWDASRPRRGRRSCGVLALSLAVLASVLASAPSYHASAQTIRGQLLDAGTGLPVEGALALLLDPVGGKNDGYLTNAQGRFLLRAPVSGVWRVKVERIGYETVTSEAVRVEDGETVDLQMTSAQIPIVMDELRVEGTRRCVVRPEEGRALARVWEEARKALANQDWTSRERVYPFRIERYQRRLDRSGRRVISEQREMRTLVGATAIRSRSAEELVNVGFVQPGSDAGRDFEYFGPDATVLLSDAFLDTHCLSLTLGEGTEGLIGVSFEPVADRDVPDIRGTLWLDGSTAELRYLEYTYTWAPYPEARGAARGRIDFEVLPSGAWIIRRWWIRTPELQVEGLGRGTTATGRALAGGRAAVVGYVEEGEEITRVTAEGEEAGALPRGWVQGVVWDSIRRGPLPDATVYLSGTSHSAMTDPSGRFALQDVPEGIYTAAFSHPGLDSLGFYPGGMEVEVRAGEVAEIALALPPRASLLAAFCRGSGQDDAPAAVVGTVRSREGGLPVPGAEVELTWTDYRVMAGRDIQPVPRSLVTNADERGRYRICGVSPGSILQVRATVDGRPGPPTHFEVEAETIGVADLVLQADEEAEAGAPETGDVGALEACLPSALGPEGGAVWGRVVDAGTRVPLGNLDVWLTGEGGGEGRMTTADGGGRFRFCGVPAGAYGLRAVFRGFGEARKDVVVEGGRELHTELPLVLSDPLRRTGLLRGRVVEAETEAPVAGATVSVGEEGAGGVRVTDEEGAFQVAGIPAGAVELSVSMLGYEDSESRVILGGGQAVEVEVRLSPRPIAMEPIVVRATRLDMQGMLADVRRRADRGWGTVLLERDLESRRNVTRTAQLLLEHGATLANNERGPALYFRRTLCAPTVYIDGIRVAEGSGGKPPFGGGGGEESARAVNLVHPLNIAAMEIYKGPAETPGEFLDSNAQCGVILIWTKRGRQ